MGSAFTPEIIMQAFRDNGQIDLDESAIPNIEGLMGMYRGNIPNDHILKQYKKIIETYYREMFLNGRVEESTFEKEHVEPDRDSQGNEVNRDFLISKENCQRAKVLSAPKQRQARLDLIASIKTNQQKKHKEYYDKETEKYDISTICTNRILDTYIHARSTTSNDGWTSDKSFEDMLPFFTRFHLGEQNLKKISKPTMAQLTAFIHLHNPIQGTKGHCPIYLSTTKIKKPDLITMALSCIKNPLNKRHFAEPTQIELEDDDAHIL